MMKILKHAGGVILFSILAFAVLLISLNMHLRWDHRRRPDGAAEATYQIGTFVYTSYVRLPAIVADAFGGGGSVIGGRGADSAMRSLFLWVFVFTILYGAVLHIAFVGVRRLLKLRRRTSANQPSQPIAGKPGSG